MPSHYLNQCSLIVNWTITNKLQWNSNQNTSLFIQENAFENVVCEMAAILSRRRRVKIDIGVCEVMHHVTHIYSPISFYYDFHNIPHILSLYYMLVYHLCDWQALDCSNENGLLGTKYGICSLQVESWPALGIHWGPSKMVAILQTIFSNAFSWMKIRVLCFEFHWSLYLGVQLTISQHCFW